MPPQWNTLKEGTILKTKYVRVKFIKNTDENNFTGQIVELLNEDYNGYNGYKGKICTDFGKSKCYEWEIENNIIDGDVKFTESNPTHKEINSLNYELLYRDSLSEIQTLQQSNKILKEVIRLLTKEI